MHTGLDGFDDDLKRIGLQYAGGQGPGAYFRLVEALGRLSREQADALAPLARAWAGRSFDAWYERPLLLLACLRFTALGDPTHPVAPEVLADAEAEGLTGRLREALEDPGLPALLAERRVQTNEPGRALGWALGVTWLRLPHRGFVLVDLACSAGLNLVADLTPVSWRVGRHIVGGLDLPSPIARLGLDRRPIDLEDPDSVRWLRACVWPGDRERLGRLEAALEAWRRASADPRTRPEVRVHTLGEAPVTPLLEDLEAAHGLPVLAFQSVVRDYMPKDQLARHEAELRAWLSGGRERLWLTLEPTPVEAPAGPEAIGGPMRLDAWLHRRSGSVHRPLARMGYHPAGCVPHPEGPAALARDWAAP